MQTDPARCHPDRPHFSVGLCRECYRERATRSKPVEAPDRSPRDLAIERELEGWTGGSETAGPGTPLSSGQTRVLEVLATGVGAKQASASLGVSQQTIKNHLSQIYARVGSRSLVETYARIGWLSPQNVSTTLADATVLVEVARVDALIVALQEVRRLLTDAVDAS